MLQAQHLSNAFIQSYQSSTVGGAINFIDQSEKFSEFHSAAAAAHAEIPSLAVSS